MSACEGIMFSTLTTALHCQAFISVLKANITTVIIAEHESMLEQLGILHTNIGFLKIYKQKTPTHKQHQLVMKNKIEE